jgi:hypothetical protein
MIHVNSGASDAAASLAAPKRYLKSSIDPAQAFGGAEWIAGLK